jgi:hypothetical protein
MKLTEIKDGLQVIAIVLGGAWAIWTFGINKEREDFVFRGKSVSAVPSCSLSVVGHSRGYYIVKAVSEVASTSRIKTHIFYSPYVFLGTFVAPIDKVSPLREFTKDANKQMQSSEKFSRAQQYARPTGVPIEIGKLWSAATYLEPNEKIHNELMFLVSDKNAQAFDWVTYSFALILAEDTSRLGLKTTFDDLWNLTGEFRIYEREKKDHFALEDESSNRYTTVPVKADGVATDATGLLPLNVGVTSVRCNIVLPPKQLVRPPA